MQALQCGAIVDNTISRNKEIHRYYTFLNEGDQIDFEAFSLAGNYETLTVDMGLWAPNGFEIDSLTYGVGRTDSPDQVDKITTEILSVSGVYTLLLIGRTETAGEYELDVTCTLADGTVINPGDAPPISLENGANGEETRLEFSGVGFPGLAPVDFSNVAELPLIEGVPMTGAVSPTGGEVLGFKFSANEGDVFDLTYTRASGNLNLGLVVLSTNNEVLFQTSLVLSETVSTQFTIPASEEYTVGVFKIDLLPPENPEPTAFQVKVDLNP